jgi:hypothetical protein
MNRIVRESEETITICVPWFYSKRPTSWLNGLLDNVKAGLERGIEVNVFLRADPVNARTFGFLKAWGAKVLLIKNLHVKFVCNEKELILTTANLTDATEKQIESYVTQDAKAPEILRVIGEMKEELVRSRLQDEEVVSFVSNLLPALFRQIEQASATDLPPDVDFTKLLAGKWNSLHNLTRRYLSAGQGIEAFLLKEARRMSGSIDFAPAVLEYAKALENELERRMFYPFKLTNPGLKPALIEETDVKVRGALEMLDGYITRNQLLTMGQMAHLLKMLFLSRNTFSDFLESRLQDENDFLHIFDFPAKLEKFNYKWRTKAAHPHQLSSEDCRQCRDYLLREPIRLLVYLTTQLR